MQNLKNVKLPSASVISGVVQTALYGSVGVYGLYNGLFNVEGGHRAIVYNRVSGVKQKVRGRRDRRIARRPRLRPADGRISSSRGASFAVRARHEMPRRDAREGDRVDGARPRVPSRATIHSEEWNSSTAGAEFPDPPEPRRAIDRPPA